MLDYLRELNFLSMTVRIAAAVVFGGIIGLERERKGRAAGFRTYMIVALGAALTMILNQYLSIMLDTAWAQTAAELGVRTDTSRLGAQVINGVGFLGAGTIIVTGRQEVKGLTTAAGLWASACVGLAIGAGFYECVIISFVLILICMCMLPFIENTVLFNTRNINIYMELDSINVLGDILSLMRKRGITMFDVEVDKMNDHIAQVSVTLDLHLPKKQAHSGVLASVSTIPGVISVDEI